jgi:hypothetical protein
MPDIFNTDPITGLGLPASPSYRPVTGRDRPNMPDIFSDDYLNRQLSRKSIQDMGVPHARYNPYEVDFFKYYLDPNYESLGFNLGADNNSGYYAAQSLGQAFLKKGRENLQRTRDTFLNNFAQYGRDAEALVTNKADSFWNTDYNAQLYDQSKFYADQSYVFAPTGSEESLKRWIPFSKGAMQAYGDLFGQLGFTQGTILAATAENVLISALTNGTGTIPAAAKETFQVYKTIAATVKTLRDSAKLSKTLKSVADLAKTYNSLSALGKGAVNLYQMYHTSAGEAAFEAAAGYAESKEEQIREFTERNGYGPSPDDLADMEKIARDVGSTRFGLNVALLMASNSIQFGNMLKPFKPTELADDVASKVIFRAGKQTAQAPIEKLGKIVSTYDDKALSRGWFLSGASATRTALKGSLTEGFEESFQNVIDLGTKKYFEAKYNDKDFVTRAAAWNAAGYGMAETFGKAEGWNNFIAGALTGVLTGGVKGAYNKIKGVNTQDPNKQAAARAVNILDSVGVKEVFNEEYANMNVQANIANSLSNTNNNYTAGNLKDLSLRSFFLTARKSGKLDVRFEQIADQRNLTAAEFASLYNITTPFTESDKEKMISKIENKLKRMSEAYDRVDSNFRNPYDLRSLTPNTKEYEDQAKRYVAYEAAKDAMFSYMDIYDSALSRSFELLDSYNESTMATGTHEFTGYIDLFEAIANSDIRADEIASLESEIALLEKGSRPKLGNLLGRISKALESRSIFINPNPEEVTIKKTILEALKSLNTTQTEESYKKALRKILGYSLTYSDNNRLRNGQYSAIDPVRLEYEVEKTYKDAMEYAQLNEDAKNARDLINFLSNPQTFTSNVNSALQEVERIMRDRNGAIVAATATPTPAPAPTAPTASVPPVPPVTPSSPAGAAPSAAPTTPPAPAAGGVISLTTPRAGGAFLAERIFFTVSNFTYDAATRSYTVRYVRPLIITEEMVNNIDHVQEIGVFSSEALAQDWVQTKYNSEQASPAVGNLSAYEVMRNSLNNPSLSQEDFERDSTTFYTTYPNTSTSAVIAAIRPKPSSSSTPTTRIVDSEVLSFDNAEIKKGESIAIQTKSGIFIGRVSHLEVTNDGTSETSLLAVESYVPDSVKGKTFDEEISQATKERDAALAAYDRGELAGTKLTAISDGKTYEIEFGDKYEEAVTPGSRTWVYSEAVVRNPITGQVIKATEDPKVDLAALKNLIKDKFNSQLQDLKSLKTMSTPKVEKVSSLADVVAVGEAPVESYITKASQVTPVDTKVAESNMTNLESVLANEDHIRALIAEAAADPEAAKNIFLSGNKTC